MDVHRSPTVCYGGVPFRSRLTARWAVLFDQLALAWDHQPDVYMLAGPPDEDPQPYLPELYLPDLGVWVHVAATPTADDLHTAAAAVMPGGLPAAPGRDGAPSLLLLGQLPRVAAPRPQHWHVSHDAAGVTVGVYDLDTRRPAPLPAAAASRWPPGPPARLWGPAVGWADLHAVAAVLSHPPYAHVQASPQLTRACATARTARLPAG